MHDREREDRALDALIVLAFWTIEDIDSSPEPDIEILAEEDREALERLEFDWGKTTKEIPREPQ